MNEQTALLQHQQQANRSAANRGVLWIRVASFIVLIAAFTAVIVIALVSKGSPYRWKFDEGVYIQFSGQDNYYVRVDSPENRLVLTESFPWIHGSALKIHRGGYGLYEFFQLQAANGKWVVVNNDGYVHAREAYQNRGTYFEMMENSETISLRPHRVASKHIHMRVRHSSRWLVAERDFIAPFTTCLKAVHGSWSSFFLGSTPENSIFEVSPITKIRGVNLGSWFIPEAWMTPSFFQGFSNASSSLCEAVMSDKDLANDRIIKHLSEWIVEEDFAEIRARGLDAVRIPLGYWNLIDDPYSVFVPSLENSLLILDNAFDLADKYGLKVLLDLHGLPGSQNGMDNSGCGKHQVWWLFPENVALSLSAVYTAAERYKDRKSLYGIELISNPSIKISRENHTELLGYYKQAYHVIRSQSIDVLVVFHEPDYWQFGSWRVELNEPEFYNVALDLHMHDTLLPFVTRNISEHVKVAEGWGRTVDKEALTTPIIVGEWSLSTLYEAQANATLQEKQRFVDACLTSFSNAIGWFIWTWKVEVENGTSSSWDLQRQLRNSSSGLHIF